MKAILLAAGVGSRLRPITDEWPKHLLEVGGKTILNRLIDDLETSEHIDEIIVIVNYHADKIRNAIDNWNHDQNLSILEQSEPLGTGDAVNTGLTRFDDEQFMVINGDVLFDESLSQIVSEFMESNTDGLILGTKVEDPSKFGVLTHQDNRLTGIEEKPKEPPSDALINAGGYIFPKEAIPLFDQLKLSDRGEKELTDVIDQLLKQNTNITIKEIEGWFDIGHPWQLLEANEYFLEEEQNHFKILGNVEEDVHIHGSVHVATGARIRSGTYIEGPVYIDENADIGPNCYIRGKTYLGRDTRVGNACEVKNSIIYHDSHTAHLSYIGDSVIGRSSNLGAGTITANLRHDNQQVRVTIKDVRKSSGRRKLGAIIGDNVKTGIGADLLPGVKISSGEWINAGETVARDRPRPK